jgi:formate hydrogenlyase subunit 3/multisubunit Na+/H+ antiporter MnhD subunit
MINKSIKKTNDHLILYAVNDCLAVTKLFMVLELNWTKAQLRQCNQNKEESE